ncbi:translation initiation factor IF-2 [Chitinophagaceae bacterium IBVUCB1]|nr:translation initiation factor IF-2 [Chitinophagaceae bacterium IBVUCB1]
MSTGTNTPRLLAAAKEFNIGKETLVEYLTGKGFEINASNPNTKLTEQMYNALQAEFAQDKAAKRKSDEIALPKGSLIDGAKKPKEEPVKEKKAEEPAAAPAPKPVAEKKAEEKPAEPAPEKPIEKIPAAEAPAPKEEPKAVEPVAAAPAEPEVAEASHIDVKAPKLGGPNILGKINLDELNQSSRPKKGAKKAEKKEEEPKEATTAASTEETTEKPKKGKKAKTEEVTEVAAEAPVEIPSAVTPAPAEEAEDDKPEHIEMKAPKLEGPKIIGRIELPVSQPGGGRDSKEKRNRKRIPVQKKPETFNPNDPNNNNNQNRGGGAQQGDRRGGGGGQQGGGFNRGGGQQGDRRGGGQQQGGGFNRGGAGGGDRRRQDRNAPVSAQQQEIDAKAIQEKIRQTQAKLAGGTRNKNLKAKYRRNKREEMAEKRAAAEENQQGNVIQVTEFISVSELASLLDVSFADVISKCMSLGIMVSINQRLDAEVIELVSSEFGYDVEFINLEQEADIEEDDTDDPEDLLPRAPIVTIMGHVDHGKTSLLDYIREANVVAGEAGGITQHIGAYQVTTEGGKKITFLDTPGHEAFTAMRARGAKVADVAVIVVAADDAIMPQTKEAISHAQAASLPMVFAINKIDKEGANPEKIKEQLAQMNILVEDWGGKFQSQEISAKKGLNIDLLLEKILLEAELLEVKANPDRYASGSVIEASLDKGRGYQSTILVQNGTLEQGDMIVCGQHFGKIKAMFNERGQRVETAGPSAPVQVLGLNGAPQAGEKFKVYEDENEAKEIANHRAQILREQGIRARKHITLDEIGRRLALGNFKELALIIKGDFDGSVEALSDSLQKLSTDEVAVNIVHKGVGQITESDVLLATASDAIILGFQVRPSLQTSRLAEQENIEIRYYSIIYDAIDEIKSAMEGLLEPKIEKKTVCNIEVREVFKIGGIGTIAGSYVLDGKMTRNTKLNLVRDGIVIHTGELSSLKRFKDDVKEVNAGYECGLMIKNYNDIRIGDIIEGYDEVEVKRTL